MKRDFEEFYRGEFPGVYRAAFALSGDRETALDATQEAFKRAFVRWSRLARTSWAGGWVMTTALNVCRKEAGKTARAGAAEPLAVAPPAGPEHVDLVAALRLLPIRQRQAVLLFYLADLPVPVVADLMNVAEGTVKAHLSQARDNLRGSLLGRHGDERDPERVEGL